MWFTILNNYITTELRLISIHEIHIDLILAFNIRYLIIVCYYLQLENFNINLINRIVHIRFDYGYHRIIQYRFVEETF